MGKEINVPFVWVPLPMPLAPQALGYIPVGKGRIYLLASENILAGQDSHCQSAGSRSRCRHPACMDGLHGVSASP